MSQIWKYRIDPQPGPPGADYATAEITMPLDAQILHLDLQDGQPTIWARVNTHASVKRKGFYVVPTGVDLPEYHLGAYVGTWQKDGLVWHVFRSRT